MSDPYTPPSTQTVDPNSELEDVVENYKFWKQTIKFEKFILFLAALITILPLIGRPSYKIIGIFKQAGFIFLPVLLLIIFSYFKLFSTRKHLENLKRAKLQESD